MKIALAFLLLGVCLVATNANAVKRRKMLEHEAYSHGRMLTIVMKRWNDWQNCQKCSDTERYCKEKAIVEDICFILRLLANDMGCTTRDLLVTAKWEIHFSYVANAVELRDFDSLIKVLRSHGKFNHFVQCICGMMHKPLKDANIELGEILVSVNNAVEGAIGAALSLLDGVLHSLTGLLGGFLGIAGGVGNALGGLHGGAAHIAGGFHGSIGNAIGGVTGGFGSALGGLAGGAVHTANGVAGGFGKAINGVAGGPAHAVGGFLSSATNIASGAAGSLAKTAGGIAGGTTNVVGGFGGKKPYHG